VRHRLAYPPDLARYVVDHWPAGLTLGLSADLLCEALCIAFQASLTAEEARPTRFRLLLTPPEALPEDGIPNQGVLRLDFAEDRPLTANELRRASPAAPFETALGPGMARAELGRPRSGAELDV
jgi:hypothetical protein